MHVKVHAALLLLVAAAGCGGGPPGAVVTCMPPECPTDTTLLLVAEVEPPNDSIYVRQEFASVSINADGLFALTLDTQVGLSGTVRIYQGAVSQMIAATVVATRPSRISGRPDVYYQSTVNPLTGEYRLVVPRNLPGEQYALTVTAVNPSLVPPKKLMVTADADQFVDLSFEDPLLLPELHGAVLDSLQQPVPGMQVQAVDPNTLSAVSTTTTTDDKGVFSVRLTSSPPALVRVVASPTLPSAELPSLSLDVATSKLSPTNSMTVNLHVPPLPAPAHITFNVGGVGTSGATILEKAATCVFTADVSDPHATDGVKAIHRAKAMTDLLGQVAVDLIPNESGNRTYAVVVSTDAQSDLSATTTTVSVAPGGGYGKDITLPLRLQVSGQVFDPLGNPLSKLMVVPGASTVAQSLGPTALGISVTPRQTTADSDGRFALRLDRGVWDIGLIPPADSMLPRLWLTNAVLETTDVDVGAVTLPRGVMVHGVVHDFYGQPLPKANVRFYTVNELNAGCSTGDGNCLVPPRLRAEGSSGADGVLSLILPSQPQQ